MTETKGPYTLSGDSGHVYVVDEGGRIVASCADVDDAKHVASALNGLPLLAEARDYVRGAVGDYGQAADLRERINDVLTEAF